MNHFLRLFLVLGAGVMLGIAAVVEKPDEEPAGLVSEVLDDNSEKTIPFGNIGAAAAAAAAAIAGTTQTSSDDETVTNVTSACAYPGKKSTGYLKNCTQILPSSAGGPFQPDVFNKSVAVACAIPNIRATKMVYYDCGAELNFTTDCSRSGTKDGIVTGCFVGPCIQLSGGRTLISYDCNV